MNSAKTKVKTAAAYVEQRCFLIMAGILVFVAFGPVSLLSGQDKEEAKHEHLKPGLHKVGFETIFVFDRSRPSVPYSDWDGRLVPTTETNGRQMQLNVWFPATLTADSSRIRYQHYVELMGRQVEFGPLSDDRKKFTDEQYINKVNSLGGNGTFNAEKLAVLKKLETRAYENAKPVDGKFPLIVFPNGGSPAFQSEMCEYWASHGFVVAALAMKGQFAFAEDVSLRGMETAVYDLGFGISKLTELPQVNKDKIGLVGNGIASSHIVAYQTRNDNVDCVVSLEGGLLSRFEQGILKRSPFYTPEAMDVPLLALHSPHPSIDPSFIAHLVYADQYVFELPSMSEFHMLNFGVFESEVPEIIGQPKGNVELGHSIGALYALNFFKAMLMDDSESLAFLTAAEPPAEFQDLVKKTHVRKGIPKPPNFAILKNAFVNEGFDAIENVYRKLKAQNPTPFTTEFYNEMRDWLAWKKDEKFEYRFRLYRLAIDSYPESAVANYYYAYFALMTDKKAVSKEFYEKTLRLMEVDDDPFLTSERKARMKTYIEEDLKKISGEDDG